ncbi:MAG: Zn-dependent hydrolase [Bacteroidales bacterium]|nr:Zn-dependent hydrolase [Candidatus Scybalousia scybalohippi]
MRKTILICLGLLAMYGTKAQDLDNMTTREKVEQYASVKLTTDLSHLSSNEKEMLGIFLDVAKIMDDIYWKQAFGNKKEINEINNLWDYEFAQINYGPWDRMNNWKPFVKGFKEKTPGVTFYPEDMTKEDFNKIQDEKKNSQYTVIRKDANGKLYVKGYYEEYKEDLDKAIELLNKAISICDNAGMKKYLVERVKALQTNDYFASDMAWMDMKDSNLDFVVGPIENYDDELLGLKTSFEAFVLVKDLAWSKSLAKYIQLLPSLQKSLPCDPKFKQEVPGTESDLNVYDVLYYGGDCNAGGKTIAINLPNDEKVQLAKGSRRLQLKNAMKAKFDAIVVPIAKQVINEDQMKLINFDAFFSNVMFHEVAHGLGIKNSITGNGPIRQALQGEYSAFEEAKADVLGLWMVNELIKRGELTGLTEEQSITTYIAGLLRSIRFGSAEAHGRANLMCYNFFEKAGAFTRDDKGIYTINFEKSKKAIEDWSAILLEIEGMGSYENAAKYSNENATISAELQQDLDKINSVGIPVDVVFEQGRKVLGL